MNTVRAFLTKRFSKELIRERIPRSIFSKAIKEIINGLSDSLGHKLHKKRIAGLGRGKRGGYRSISYYRSNDLIIFIYLYAKNEKESLDTNEMKELILISREYDKLDAFKTDSLVNNGFLVNFDYNID